MEWIRIKERTPNDEKDYLVLTETGVTKVSKWSTPEAGQHVPYRWRSVVGWAELPEIPKGFDHRIEEQKLKDSLTRAKNMVTRLDTIEKEIDRETKQIKAQYKTIKGSMEIKLKEVTAVIERLLGSVNTEEDLKG